MHINVLVAYGSDRMKRQLLHPGVLSLFSSLHSFHSSTSVLVFKIWLKGDKRAR